MAEQEEALGRSAPVIEPGHTFATVTDKISSIVLTRPTSKSWIVGFTVGFALTMMMLFAIGYLVVRGTGIWGINIPIGWGFAIVNFVWWIGIGHAGTLISAILLLLRQSWRNSINRFAEAMTLFAVMAAGIFPLIHTGRPWLAYWMFPYPQHHGVLATVPKPADLGCVRGLHLLHHFISLLVHRTHPGSGNLA
jgi:molybdopterin-containing oxidoreductase family membrane subunit